MMSWNISFQKVSWLYWSRAMKAGGGETASNIIELHENCASGILPSVSLFWDPRRNVSKFTTLCHSTQPNANEAKCGNLKFCLSWQPQLLQCVWLTPFDLTATTTNSCEDKQLPECELNPLLGKLPALLHLAHVATDTFGKIHNVLGSAYSRKHVRAAKFHSKPFSTLFLCTFVVLEWFDCPSDPWSRSASCKSFTPVSTKQIRLR